LPRTAPRAALRTGRAGLKEVVPIWRVACGEIAAGRPLLIPTKSACSEAGIAGPGRDVSVAIGNTPCAGGLTLTCCMLDPVLALPRGFNMGRVTVWRKGCLRGDTQTALPLPGAIGAHVRGGLAAAVATGGAPAGAGVTGVTTEDGVCAGAAGTAIDSRDLRTRLPLIVRHTNLGETSLGETYGCPAATTTFAFQR